MFDIYDEDIDQIEQQLDLQFDESRREAIKTYHDVQTCPGSGKTTMVATKLLILAKKWKSKYQGICVLTHTNVAKDEIIGRLKHKPEGLKLLQYPHFIGTIQEFVNKFLAIPCLKSSGFSITQIDDELTFNKAWSMLDYPTKQYLTQRHIKDLKGLQYQWTNDLVLNIPGFNKESTSHSYIKLNEIKTRLIEKGYFFYEEMYSFAQYYVNQNPSLISSVQHRFPVVIIDEMQDTNNHQDELLNKLFANSNVCFQRFGDPDQAIYSGSGNGEENSYNTLTNIEKIENSHRFVPAIANLAKRMSSNEINLCSVLDEPEETGNTIFLVDENSRHLVLNHFSTLCCEHIDVDSLLPIKAVGATGKNGSNGLDITYYYSDFSKNKSRKSFKPNTLIQYFYKANQTKEFSQGYTLILEGIARAANLSNAALPGYDYYTISNLKKYLKDSGRQKEFNGQVLKIIQASLSMEQWPNSIESLLNIIQVNDLSGNEVSSYLEFQDTPSIEKTDALGGQRTENKILVLIEGKEVEIEFETIHSVKGETHSATLVLETKYYKNDMHQMINHILGTEESPPTTARKQKFMKQLYVAFSRPKHLLCIAMDRGGFPEAHIGKESHAGWKIVDLTTN